MGSTELPDGLIEDVAPPSRERRFNTFEWFVFALYFIWTSLLTIVDIVVAIYRTFYPPYGKSICGKVVLVTGAGRGLGRGLALGFFKEGCKVAVVDVNFTTASKTAAMINEAGGVAKAYLCNVASPEDIRALREAVTSDLGPVDILVNNAAIIYAGGLLENCLECDIRAVLEVNLMSHFWYFEGCIAYDGNYLTMMKEFLPSMKARNSGHIVAIASAASFVGGETGSAYISSKFGVRGLMEVVRLELELKRNNNIHTTTVYPYFINTSADYVSRWKVRVPPVSIQEAVAATIAGIRTKSISVFIPRSLQIALKLKEFLPLRSYIRFKKMLLLGTRPKKERRPTRKDNKSTAQETQSSSSNS